MNNSIRFQDALIKAISFVETHHDYMGSEPILVRDLYGKIRVLLHCKPTNKLQALAKEFSSLLDKYAYPADASFIFKDDLFNADSIIDSPDKIKIPETTPIIYLLDRQVTGQDWLRKPIHEEKHPPRVTLFGIKGGVGRSTALAIWAWYLANKDKKVLVIDLDLESPGIGQILLPMDRTPDFGVVDWLIEDAVGQADDLLLREMVATSPLSSGSSGEIRVVAAAGSKEQDYIAKLSRIYMDINQEGKQVDFAHRLAKMLQQLEAQEKPDIVLLDSRAGLHDIAAIAITRLTDLALLFAINTPQTWQAYRFLFTHWQKWNNNLESFRENLRVVAGMIPELGREDYLSRCAESAYALFSDTIYEEIGADDVDGFNYAMEDSDSPHHPIEILWNITFQEFNPTSADYFKINHAQLQACYGNFLIRATELALGENIA